MADIRPLLAFYLARHERSLKKQTIRLTLAAPCCSLRGRNVRQLNNARENEGQVRRTHRERRPVRTRRPRPARPRHPQYYGQHERLKQNHRAWLRGARAAIERIDNVAEFVVAQA
jgi:hypothetical protein